MADDVTILDSTGAPATVATDQVTDSTFGTAHVQYVKVIDGTVDSTNRQIVSSDGSQQVGAIVNDTPNNYTPGDVKALSLTPEGRLRVSTVPSDINNIWQHTFDAMGYDNPWEMESYFL